MMMISFHDHLPWINSFRIYIPDWDKITAVGLSVISISSAKLFSWYYNDPKLTFCIVFVHFSEMS